MDDKTQGPPQTKGSPPPYPGNQAPNPPSNQSPYPPSNQSPYPPGNQAAYPPPPQQQPPYMAAQPGYPAGVPNSTTVYAVQPQPQPIHTTAVVVTGRGSCPNCRVGNLVEEFTCCGIICAILFFPLGVLCCFLMRARVCTHCHVHF